MSERPALSVIVPCYNSRGTIERCLQSLEKQSQQDFEVIVVDSSEDGSADLIASRFPGVRLVRAAKRLFPGEARNRGIRQARAAILAFLDADAIADQDWTQEIARAHRSPEPAIGGSIDNGNPESLVSWGAYFCEFSQWMPFFPRRRMADIPTCCLSVKRRAYEQHGPFLEGTYCSDTAFNWKLTAAGEPPLFIPTIRVLHINIDRLGLFLGKQLMHGRAFAQVRVAQRELPRLMTAVLALGSPTLPFLLVGRIARRVFQNKPYIMRFLAALPWVFAGLVAWSAGECLGYIRGLRSRTLVG